MKDYSSFFMQSETFIKKIMTNEGKLKIKFSGTKKNVTRNLTKKEFEDNCERLENQYTGLSKNLEKILIKKFCALILFLSSIALICYILITRNSMEVWSLSEKIYFGIGLSCVVSLETVLIVIKSEIDKIKNATYILKNKEAVRDTLEKTIDIKEELSKNVYREVSKMQELQSEIKTDIINAKFVDDLGNRDLKRIVERTEIEIGLTNPVEVKPLVRTRKLNNKRK